MAQCKCTECGQLFDKRLAVCPKCGKPVNKCDFTDIEGSDKTPITEHTTGENTKKKNLKNEVNETTTTAKNKEKEIATPKHEENGIITTDTGYANEKAVAKYADFIFICTTLACIALYIASIYIVNELGKDSSTTGKVAFWGVIITAIWIILLYIAKAFIKIYANISINLHELNMKSK